MKARYRPAQAAQAGRLAGSCGQIPQSQPRYHKNIQPVRKGRSGTVFRRNHPGTSPPLSERKLWRRRERQKLQQQQERSQHRIPAAADRRRNRMFSIRADSEPEAHLRPPAPIHRGRVSAHLSRRTRTVENRRPYCVVDRTARRVGFQPQMVVHRGRCTHDHAGKDRPLRTRSQDSDPPATPRSIERPSPEK